MSVEKVKAGHQFKPTYDPSHYYAGEYSDDFTRKSYIKDNVIRICYPGGKVSPLRRQDLTKVIKGHYSELSGCSIIDPKEMIIYVLDGNGGVIPPFRPLSGDYTLPNFTTNVDIYGNRLINVKMNQEIGEPTEAPIVKSTDLTFDKIYNLIYNPAGFKSSNLISDRMNDIISNKLFKSEHFDEIFAIERDRPESPLMRKYTDILAKSVNEEIEKSGEIGDLEELEKEAYEKSGYVGKSIDVVRQEFKDYQGYFRFLITRKEKKVITEEENNLADQLVSLLDAKTEIRRAYRILEVNRQLALISGITVVENLVTTSAPRILYFKKLNPIWDYKSLGEDQYFTSKIVVLDEIAKDVNGRSVEVWVYAFDEFLNLAIINIKSATLLKWKTKMAPAFSHVEDIIKASSNTLILNSNVSI